MLTLCKNLAELSAAGKWDEVFECLQVDANATIELGTLRTNSHDPYNWLKQHKANLNSLEIILAIILIFDQIFYIVLILYLILFAYRFIRFHITQKLKKRANARKLKAALLAQRGSKGSSLKLKEKMLS